MAIKYSFLNSSRQVRVFFAEDNASANRSLRIRRSRGPRKNYVEDSEDKPIQESKFILQNISQVVVVVTEGYTWYINSLLTETCKYKLNIFFLCLISFLKSRKLQLLIFYFYFRLRLI